MKTTNIVTEKTLDELRRLALPLIHGCDYNKAMEENCYNKNLLYYTCKKCGRRIERDYNGEFNFCCGESVPKYEYFYTLSLPRIMEAMSKKDNLWFVDIDIKGNINLDDGANEFAHWKLLQDDKTEACAEHQTEKTIQQLINLLK